MKFSHRLPIFLFVVFLAQSYSVLISHPILPPDHIEEVVMADEVFKYLTSNHPTIILGFMNNCPHCKTLMNFFKTLPKKYDTINLVIINGPRLHLHTEVAKLSENKFKIPGYPSVVFIKNQKIKDLQIGGNPKILEEKIKKLLKMKK